jgi:hypothetical protein
MEHYCLFEQFFQEIQPKNKPAYFTVKFYVFNSRMKSKIFTLSRYGSRGKAREAAIQYFQSIYGFKPPESGINP